jgi:hypothetical protein
MPLVSSRSIRSADFALPGLMMSAGVGVWAVRAQAKQVSDEAEHLAKTRAQVCVEMAEKQGRIAALEMECATLKQVSARNLFVLALAGFAIL